MIEHVAGDSLRTASGRLKIDTILTPPERLPKMREFMISNKPFKENTANPLLGAEPPKHRFNTVEAAIGALQMELIYFFQAFENNPGHTTRNPFFGDLNFDENVQLLYKHAVHHLKQFGVEV